MYKTIQNHMHKKVTLFLKLIMLLLITTNMQAAGTGIQDALDRKISLELKDVLLKEALDKIGNLADVSFIYAGSSVVAVNKVNVNAHNEKVGDLLNKLLKPYSLSYTVLYDRIVIRQSDKKISTLFLPRETEA